MAQARNGKIAVLQFHGVPDTAHAWVNTPQGQFESYLNFLAVEKCTVIPLRDLARYVDLTAIPADPLAIVEERKRQLELKKGP